jgi:hypothetical protein
VQGCQLPIYITNFVAEVGGLGLSHKEFCLRLIMVYVQYEFAGQSMRFRVVPKGVV